MLQIRGFDRYVGRDSGEESSICSSGTGRGGEGQRRKQQKRLHGWRSANAEGWHDKRKCRKDTVEDKGRRANLKKKRVRGSEKFVKKPGFRALEEDRGKSNCRWGKAEEGRRIWY